MHSHKVTYDTAFELECQKPVLTNNVNVRNGISLGSGFLSCFFKVSNLSCCKQTTGMRSDCVQNWH